MMRKLQKIVSVKILTMIALSIIAMFHSNSSFAGMPEKYGIAYTSDGKEYLKVQLYTKSCPVWSTGPDFPPIIDLIYCSYGTVTWYWGDIIDGGTKLIGTRIEETGSFAVKAGSYIGLDSWHGTGANGSSNMISIYPMMQYDGMNVLLTDISSPINRLGDRNQIWYSLQQVNEEIHRFSSVFRGCRVQHLKQYGNDYIPALINEMPEGEKPYFLESFNDSPITDIKVTGSDIDTYPEIILKGVMASFITTNPNLNNS